MGRLRDWLALTVWANLYDSAVSGAAALTAEGCGFTQHNPLNELHYTGLCKSPPPTAAHGLGGCHNPRSPPPTLCLHCCTLHFLILLHTANHPLSPPAPAPPPRPPPPHTLPASFSADKLLTRLMHLYQKSRAALLCVVCESPFPGQARLP